MNWLKRWDVPSSSDPNRTYIVAIDDKGDYGCSCPAWKFQRKQCKHIRRIQSQEILPLKAAAAGYIPKPTVTKRAAATPTAVIPSKPVGRFFNFDD